MQSLAEMIENTSQRINAAVFNIMQESGLPAYLTEGIILGVLADVRERKAAELVMSIREEEKKAQAEENKEQNQEGRKEDNGDATECTENTVSDNSS